jgi:hypothetical protein
VLEVAVKDVPGGGWLNVIRLERVILHDHASRCQRTYNPCGRPGEDVEPCVVAGKVPESHLLQSVRVFDGDSEDRLEVRVVASPLASVGEGYEPRSREIAHQSAGSGVLEKLVAETATQHQNDMIHFDICFLLKAGT